MISNNLDIFPNKHDVIFASKVTALISYITGSKNTKDFYLSILFFVKSSCIEDMYALKIMDNKFQQVEVIIQMVKVFFYFYPI